MIESKNSGSAAIRSSNPILCAKAVHFSCSATLSSVGAAWHRPCVGCVTQSTQSILKSHDGTSGAFLNQHNVVQDNFALHFQHFARFVAHSRKTFFVVLASRKMVCAQCGCDGIKACSRGCALKCHGSQFSGLSEPKFESKSKAADGRQRVGHFNTQSSRLRMSSSRCKTPCWHKC